MACSREPSASDSDTAQVEALTVPLRGVQTLVVDVALTARAAQSDDVAHDYRVPPALRSAWQAAGMEAMVAVPILTPAGLEASGGEHGRIAHRRGVAPFY